MLHENILRNPHTVDGSEILLQLRLVVCLIIYLFLYIPGGAEFLPSTVHRHISDLSIPRQKNMKKEIVEKNEVFFTS